MDASFSGHASKAIRAKANGRAIGVVGEAGSALARLDRKRKSPHDAATGIRCHTVHHTISTVIPPTGNEK
jgi:hypothetical protein